MNTIAVHANLDSDLFWHRWSSGTVAAKTGAATWYPNIRIQRSSVDRQALFAHLMTGRDGLCSGIVRSACRILTQTSRSGSGCILIKDGDTLFVRRVAFSGTDA